jgi:fumarylacetoacetate (FAA) hydrolase
MKLVTYTLASPSTAASSLARPGLLVTSDSGNGGSGAVVLDLMRALAWTDGKQSGAPKDERALADEFGDSVLGFIERARDARPVATEALAAHGRGELPAKTDAGLIVIPASEVTLLSPIPRPPSMRDGYAFRQHVETARRNRGLDMIPEFDQFPVFYFTNHQAVIGPGPLHVRPRHLERLDFELEAAVVVGREARDLTAENADEVIFGMTIMNDFSARALQMQEMLLSLGPAKGKDFATGLGPYLVTMDELAERTVKTAKGNTFDLGMRAFVNGVQVSKGNVNDMTWTFAQILERASYGVSLYPGDVIGSGTCGTGCFLELNGSKITNDQWLKPGDVVALEIDRLGRLENHVVAD